ncbi:MAG: Fe-S-containing protein [Dehalococcoidia bacterium]
MRTGTIVKPILIAATATLILAAAACGGGGKNEAEAQQSAQITQATSGKISPTWIVSPMSGDAMTISKKEVGTVGMAHFKVPVGKGKPDLTFMAYTIDGKMQVRANVCVPCRSISFTLDGDKLVCNACSTVFSATDGKGVSGPCKNYPKASVDYQVSGDSIVMQMMDLQTAYDDTMKPG